jgi:hypothetical protein
VILTVDVVGMQDAVAVTVTVWTTTVVEEQTSYATKEMQ